MQPRQLHIRLDISTRMRKLWCSNPERGTPQSLKQAITAPLLNARQQVQVSRILEKNIINQYFVSQ